MAGVLALHFDEPVQFIEIVCGPFNRCHAHEDAKRFFNVSIVGNEVSALRDAKDMTVDDKNAFSKVAEIQNCC